MKCCYASSGWIQWTTSSLIDADAFFPSSPASKFVWRSFQEAEPRRLSGTASVWCWFALVTGCRERFDTLWPAGYFKKHRGSAMTCRCFISARLQKIGPSLHLYRRTRHVGVWSWRSNTWAPINVVLRDHARKAVDQPWTSYACNWVKHDRKSNKNSDAVTGNLWKVNVSVSWLFGNLFFVSNSGQSAVHYAYKFVTSLIKSDRIVEYSSVR